MYVINPVLMKPLLSRRKIKNLFSPIEIGRTARKIQVSRLLTAYFMCTHVIKYLRKFTIVRTEHSSTQSFSICHEGGKSRFGCPRLQTTFYFQTQKRWCAEWTKMTTIQILLAKLYSRTPVLLSRFPRVFSQNKLTVEAQSSIWRIEHDWEITRKKVVLYNCTEYGVH